MANQLSSLRRNHDGDPISSTNIDNRPGKWRGIITLSIAGVAVSSAIAGVLATSHKSEVGGLRNSDELGNPNPNVISLTIDSGTEIQRDPIITDNNTDQSNLIATTNAGITILGIRGVNEIYTSVEGWYGVSLGSLDELGDNIEDPDGIGWFRTEDGSVEVTTN